ncbi:MAG: homoserine kinase [Silvibacterium sp.]|nr:homoserine kinase [Silvibacterium sp.]MBV8438366.1 homoserine kinase [Silvibacterium sp.]
MSPAPLHLRLPATSANLGPGFDTLGLALNRYLEISATEAETFSIHATGRAPEVCGSLRRNLLLDVYQKTLAAQQRDVQPLALEVVNGIPLGMGCGSSAAVRLAGVALAAHFGRLGWGRERILVEATRFEGHPDNAAACWQGGFVAGCWDGGTVRAVSFALPAAWQALVVIPEKPLATSASRAVLPTSYQRVDVVANLQRAALLTAAFASGRGELVAEAMRDRMHQPYRSKVCPLLPQLLPLSGSPGILGVCLSGAGPAVLVLVESPDAVEAAEALIIETCRRETGAGIGIVEILRCKIENQPAMMRS